ncbi:hypothetical protein SASPL_126974 [Salvia splendens]|uniref:Proteasome subunit beta n=1 Tax=Salvia splendens TaxID=180675 RepID=A0A8X8XMT8_SALSN|nr:hypothetical protein SASPL_126974 [Salvia splendens]
MRRPPQSAEAHVQSAKSAADRLRSVLQNFSLPPKLDLQEVASLLIDVIRCADGIAVAVGELAREAGFEGFKTTEAATAVNRHGIVSPVDDGDHVSSIMDSIYNDLNAPHSMGTTIIGVTYDGGVVLGADSRTSTGMYVANRASDKITQLTDNVYICRSGSAADSQVLSDYVRYYLHQHTIQLGQPATVKVAANLVRMVSYNNKNMLQTGLIVGGWDKYEGGKIYGIPLGGTLLEQPFTIGGSGSSYLYGFFDQVWKEGMTQDEAEKLVVKAVSLAIARDGASGGVVRTVTVSTFLIMQYSS